MLSRRGWMAAAAPVAWSLAGCGAVARGAGVVPAPRPAPTAASGVANLSVLELQWARTAWRFVENNTDYETGLVASADRQPAFTMSHLADALAATVAGHELRIIDEREFDLRLSRLLGFLGGMDLAEGGLPNKVYHAGSGKAVGWDGQPADIGWSGVDIGRLLLWLKIVSLRHPRFQEYAERAVLRWNFCEVLDDCGTLHGRSRSATQAFRYQEGRLGYEQLAGAGFAAWGFDARNSAGLPRLETVNIYGLPVRYDARDPRTTGAPAPLLTMPFVLAGIELGWDAPAAPGLRELAQQVYRVQEERWRRDHQFTARTDYLLREAPYAVLDTVYASGYPWNTIGHDGKEHDKLALVSTRAAFGLWVLWPGEYTRRLVESIQHLYDPDRGWFEGRYEGGGLPNAHRTLPTNAGILEALLFKSRGKLYAGADKPGVWAKAVADPFRRLGRCWPGERKGCAG